MTEKKKVSYAVGLSFLIKHFIMFFLFGVLIIYILWIFIANVCFGGYLRFRLSNNGWKCSTGIEYLETSHPKLHTDGRFFQIGPLILDCYGATRAVGEGPVMNDTNGPAAR